VELQEYLDGKKMLTDSITIQDGSVVYVQLNIDVFLTPQYQPFEEQITTQILGALTTFFNVKNWNYGQALRQIDVLKSLANINEPYKYDIQFVVEPQNLASPLVPNNPNLTNSMEVVPQFNAIIRPSNVILNYNYE